MKTYSKNLRRGWVAGIVAAGIALAAPAASDSKKDRKFDVLEIGTRSYTNVTVTPTPTHIIVTHTGGMETLRVANLPIELKEKLGYEIPKPKTNAVAGWTKAQVAKLNQQDIRQISRNVQAQLLPALRNPRSVGPVILGIVAAALLGAHLFFSYCGLLICLKTGNPPGALIWIPVLQLLPLTRAAGMAPIWFVVWFLPGLNLVALVVWSFRIARVRNKGAGTALLLLFPLTSVFAFMYLAFSGSPAKPKDAKPKAPEIMTLEAA